MLFRWPDTNVFKPWTPRQKHGNHSNSLPFYLLIKRRGRTVHYTTLYLTDAISWYLCHSGCQSIDCKVDAVAFR